MRVDGGKNAPNFTKVPFGRLEHAVLMLMFNLVLHSIALNIIGFRDLNLGEIV